MTDMPPWWAKFPLLAAGGVGFSSFFGSAASLVARGVGGCGCFGGAGLSAFGCAAETVASVAASFGDDAESGISRIIFI